MKRHEISGLPVVAADGRPVGILTNRDIRFERNLEQPVSAMMTKKLITIAEGTSVEAAKELLHKNRIEKLLVVDGGGYLKGLVTIKDIEKAQRHPIAAKDELGRLRTGGAVGTGSDRDERVDALMKAGCDVICIDTAHGHSKNVIQAVADVRRELPEGADHRRQRRDGRGARSRSPRRAPTPSRSASAPGRSARRASWPASACRRSAPSPTARRRCAG